MSSEKQADDRPVELAESEIEQVAGGKAAAPKPKVPFSRPTPLNEDPEAGGE